MPAWRRRIRTKAIRGRDRVHQKSLQIFEELGLFDQVACTLDNAALLYAEYGNRERARECLTRAASLPLKRSTTGRSLRSGPLKPK